MGSKGSPSSEEHASEPSSFGVHLLGCSLIARTIDLVLGRQYFLTQPGEWLGSYGNNERMNLVRNDEINMSKDSKRMGSLGQDPFSVDVGFVLLMSAMALLDWNSSGVKSEKSRVGLFNSSDGLQGSLTHMCEGIYSVLVEQIGDTNGKPAVCGNYVCGLREFVDSEKAIIVNGVVKGTNFRFFPNYGMMVSARNLFDGMTQRHWLSMETRWRGIRRSMRMVKPCLLMKMMNMCSILIWKNQIYKLLGKMELSCTAFEELPQSRSMRILLGLVLLPKKESLWLIRAIGKALCSGAFHEEKCRVIILMERRSLYDWVSVTICIGRNCEKNQDGLGRPVLRAVVKPEGEGGKVVEFVCVAMQMAECNKEVGYKMSVVDGTTKGSSKLFVRLTGNFFVSCCICREGIYVDPTAGDIASGVGLEATKVEGSINKEKTGVIKNIANGLGDWTVMVDGLQKDLLGGDFARKGTRNMQIGNWNGCVSNGLVEGKVELKEIGYIIWRLCQQVVFVAKCHRMFFDALAY